MVGVVWGSLYTGSCSIVKLNWKLQAGLHCFITRRGGVSSATVGHLSGSQDGERPDFSDGSCPQDESAPTVFRSEMFVLSLLAGCDTTTR